MFSTEQDVKLSNWKHTIVTTAINILPLYLFTIQRMFCAVNNVFTRFYYMKKCWKLSLLINSIKCHRIIKSGINNIIYALVVFVNNETTWCYNTITNYYGFNSMVYIIATRQLTGFIFCRLIVVVLENSLHRRY